MASSRNINAPGIDLREIDRSNYTTQNNSLPNAPAVFMTGFADKGENYAVKWVNSIASLESIYGKPTTEFETLFHNACIEVINRGGICLASKLPYDNDESKTYTYCDYSVDSKVHIISDDYAGTTISTLYSHLDSNLTSCIEISATSQSGKISLDEFDDLKVGNSKSLLRTQSGNGIIRVVDISKSRLQKADFNCVSSWTTSGIQWTNECLGIFPVIVTPANALYWQYLHLNDNETAISNGNEVCLSDFNSINMLTCINTRGTSEVANLDKLYDNELYHPSSSLKSQQTISKFTAELFPSIPYASDEHLMTRDLKNICIAVVQAFVDQANGNKVNYQVLESFIGSLDRRAKNESGASIFIDDIVNNNSRMINVFSNADQKLFDRASTIITRNQTATMIGFYNDDCVKRIDVSNSILKPISTVLETIRDPNQYPFDIIVDAGVSNIAQYIMRRNIMRCNMNDIEAKSFVEQEMPVWELNDTIGSVSDQTEAWRTVLSKFDTFCKFTRKDCMFIADGLRPFCLEGNQKIVRKTKLGSTVEKDILPKLRYMTGLNSSYSAGYCDWFQMNDYYSGDLFWCPPSIKAVSIYIYCDTYFHTWDAPAGMTRGIVPNVVDVAFSPTNEEAGKIYDQCWNYAINYPIDGIIMEGQKTFQLNKTALDRVNVRRLLLGIEKKVNRAAKYFLYEGNTEYHRQRFVDTIRPIFENAVSGGGIIEYAIKCDDVLNTPQVIDNNELRCKIAIKPVKTIEYIVIDLVTTTQAASVSEEVLK